MRPGWVMRPPWVFKSIVNCLFLKNMIHSIWSLCRTWMEIEPRNVHANPRKFLQRGRYWKLNENVDMAYKCRLGLCIFCLTPKRGEYDIIRLTSLPFTKNLSPVRENWRESICYKRFKKLNRPHLRWCLCGSVVRASERGIRRSEVRFLVGIQDFFCPMLVTRRKNDLSLKN